MEAIERLQHKLSHLESNIEAERLFNKNLELFKKYLRPLYDYYSNYTNKELDLVFSPDGYINVRNKGGHDVYPMAPRAFAEKQLKEFQKYGRCKALQFQDNQGQVEGYLHQELMNEILQLYSYSENYQHRLSQKVPDYVQTLLVLGLGAGFHLYELLKSHEIRNLCIYDPHDDSVYISMHLIDWEVVLEYFSRPGYNLEICVGKTPLEGYTQLAKFFNRIGIYNLSKYFTYVHYSSPEMKQLYQLFDERAQNISFGMGFYDDERVGLAHTIENISRRHPVARKSYNARNIQNPLTAIIVGNGPSLDENEDFIRANADKCILISCGTALASLEKKGIKPDFHLEQERPYNQYVWLKESTSAEFRKGIYFFGLNTVHPKVYELFDADKGYLLVKPNDLGGRYVFDCLDRYHGNTMVLADMCNPTVTNFGASLCVTLGVKKAVLVGVDLGVADPTKHHSADSAYYDTDFDFEAYLEKQGMFKVPGNLGGEVWSTMVYQMSRQAFEAIINRYNVQLVNVNNGSVISGAIGCKSSDIEITVDEALVKAEYYPHLLADIFSSEGITPIDKDRIKTDVLKDLATSTSRIVELLQNAKPQSEQDIFTVIRDVHYQVTQVENVYVRGLLDGTTQYVLSIISSQVGLADSEHHQVIFDKAKLLLIQFLEKMQLDLDRRMFDLDEYSFYKKQ